MKEQYIGIATTKLSSTAIEIENLLKQQIQAGGCGLLKLIRNPHFEFEKRHTYRMQNHYTQLGMLKAKRNSLKGKRRYSFFDLAALDYLIECRTHTKRGQLGFFKYLLDEVMWQNLLNEDEASQFELKLMTSLVLLGVQDLTIKQSHFTGDQIFMAKNYYLSKWTQRKLKGLDINTYRNSLFLTSLIFNIDSIRELVGLKVICPENLVMLKNTELVNQRHISNGINSLPNIFKTPIKERFREFSCLYKDQAGMIYGVELTQIGHSDFIAPEDKINFKTSFEDVIKSFNK